MPQKLSLESDIKKEQGYELVNVMPKTTKLDISLILELNSIRIGLGFLQKCMIYFHV